MTGHIQSQTLSGSANAAGVHVKRLLPAVREGHIRRLLGVQLSTGEIGGGDLVTVFLASSDAMDGGTNTAQAVMDHQDTFVAQIRDNQQFTPPEHPLHGIVWMGELFAGVQDASGGNATLHATIFFEIEKVSRGEWMRHLEIDYWTRTQFEN